MSAEVNSSCSTSTGSCSTWVAQSPAISFSDYPQFGSVLYFAIVFCSLVLFHSSFINGMKFRSIRICTDLAAFFTIVQAAGFLGCIDTCSPLNSTILINIIGNCIGGAITQGCDNYITFSRFAAIFPKLPKAASYMAFLYVFIFLYLSWWPFFSFAPFFADMNSDVWVIAIISLSIYVSFIGYVLYNFFFTGIVVVTLLHHGSHSFALSSGSSASGYRKLAAKAIIHNLISITGVATYTFQFPIGMALQNILVVGSLHFLFNWKGTNQIMDAMMGVSQKGTTRHSLMSMFKTEANPRQSMTLRSEMKPRVIAVDPARSSKVAAAASKMDEEDED